jgi:hypothetical protein
MTDKTPNKMRNQIPFLASKFALDEEVVYGLLAILAETTPIDKGMVAVCGAKG